MATFVQWYKAHVASGKPVRNYLYAGGLPALAADVEEYLRPRFDSVTTLDGTKLTFSEVEEAFSARYVIGGLTLVVIRDAHKVHHDFWRSLERWHITTDRKFRQLRYVLATAPDRVNLRNADDDRVRVLATSFGQFIDCRQITMERQVDYARLRLTRSRGVIGGNAPFELLVSKCGGDIHRLRSECGKLEYVLGPRAISADLVEAIVVPSPGEMFVEALIDERRREAAERAPFVSSLPFVLGAIDYALSAIISIRTASRKTKRIADVANSTGLDPYVVFKYRPLARRYDRATVIRRYRALVAFEREMARAHDPAEVLVPLIARW